MGAWVVSATPLPLYPWGKRPVLMVQEAGLAPGSVWNGVDKILFPRRGQNPERSSTLIVPLPTELSLTLSLLMSYMELIVKPEI
jgi:hypothetical protein